MIAGLVRLKTRADFVRVAAGRSRAVRPAFIVQAAPQPTGNDNGGTSTTKSARLSGERSSRNRPPGASQRSFM